MNFDGRKRIMTLIEKLDNLIRTFKEKEVVGKIVAANGDYIVYENEKKRMLRNLKNFKRRANKILETKCYVMDYQISPQDALQIAFICMMTNIRDNDLFGDPEELPEALRKIEGKCATLAKNIAYFLSVQEGLGLCFSDYDEKELLKKIFS